MSYAAAVNALMRRKLLEQMYDRMTDEEKRLFVQMTMQNKTASDIMRELKLNQQKLEHIVKHIDKDRWYVSFSSDVAANILTTATSWLVGKLLAK